MELGVTNHKFEQAPHLSFLKHGVVELTLHCQSYFYGVCHNAISDTEISQIGVT